MRHPSFAGPRHRTLVLAVLLCLVALPAASVPVAAQAPENPPPPAITSVSPAVVGPGDKIRIVGRNFTQMRAVSMAGLALRYRVKSRRVIVARAPANAVRGTIVVATRGGTATSRRVIVVTPRITIDPESGPAGSAITVFGKGFIPGEPVDLYYGRVPVAAVAADGRGRLRGASLTVPVNALPGPSFVRVQGRFSGVPVDAAHEVTSPWPQRGLHPDGNRHTRDDVYLGVTRSPTLRLDWVADALGPSRSSPAVVDGSVWVGADTGALLTMPVDCAAGGRTCNEVALGIARGAVGSSPAVHDGVVYVGSEDGRLYAFDAACPADERPCEPLWSYGTGGPVSSSPVVDGEVVVVGSDDGSVYAFDVACEPVAGICAPRWMGKTRGPVRSSPAIHDGVAYVGSGDGFLYAFDTDCASGDGTCEPLWRGWSVAAVRSSPAVANGIVYVGSADSRVHGFPIACADDGRVCQAIWRGDADAAVTSAPVVADGLVVVGTTAGSVMAFPTACTDRDAGCPPTWTADTGGPVRSSAAVSGAAQGGPMVFIGSDDGFLYGYPLKCRPVGKPLRCQAVWASGTSAPISASPAIVDGAVYVSSEDGTIRRWSLP